MKLRKLCFFLLINGCGLALLSSTMTASAQREPGNKKYQLPADKKLLELHKQFVLEAEKLAKDYKKNNELDKCRVVCEEILKMVPSYPGAVRMLQEIREEEENAGMEEIDVAADKAWQNSGIYVLKGKPIKIETKVGSKWTFKMSYDLTPEGMEIPKEFRDFKLGALIGFIETPDMRVPKPQPPGKRGREREDRDGPRPFHIGNSTEFTARQEGLLWLRMHDDDPRDNEGKIRVRITGTYRKIPVKKTGG